jgi:hypothetical protein
VSKDECSNSRSTNARKASSNSDLLSFLKDNHFEEKHRKHSLKCDTKQNYSVPTLFDEGSAGFLSSAIGSLSPFRLCK